MKNVREVVGVARKSKKKRKRKHTLDKESPDLHFWKKKMSLSRYASGIRTEYIIELFFLCYCKTRLTCFLSIIFTFHAPFSFNTFFISFRCYTNAIELSSTAFYFRRNIHIVFIRQLEYNSSKRKKNILFSD